MFFKVKAQAKFIRNCKLQKYNIRSHKILRQINQQMKIVEQSNKRTRSKGVIGRSQSPLSMWLASDWDGAQALRSIEI